MDKLRMESPDLTAQNIDRIAALISELRHGDAGRGTQHAGEEGVQAGSQF